MKKIIALIFLSALALMLTGCAGNKYTYSYYDVFDTFSSITLYCEDVKEAKSVSDELHEELLRLNNLFDIYNNYEGVNNIKTINDNAGKAPVNVDEDIISLLSEGKNAYAETDGTVNIALGSVLEIWHKYRENALENEIYAVPSDEELKAASQHTDINSIVIDDINSTVYITDPEVSIDVGAIAKGYATDYARKFLKERGIGAGMVNLGGNLIVLNDENKKSFKTGITSPEGDGKYSDIIFLSNSSAVTSGSYQRYYEYNGKRYNHIIDGKTLYPAENNKSVTIVDESSLKGDIFSTALFILPYEDGKALAEKNNVEALWITSADEKYKTDNFGK